MAVNPDPKPGRWILPLVVLGMVAFTYFFVRELPEASPDTTLAAGPDTSTTVPQDNGDGGGGNGEGSTSTTPGTPPLDSETQAYLDEIDSINDDLQVQRTELVTVNEAFNQDPREVEFSEAEDRFEAVETAVADLSTSQDDLSPPGTLTDNHQSLLSAINLASDSVTEALEGLRSTDTGEQRNSAVDAFTTAAANYRTEVTNTHNAAGSSGGGDDDGGNGDGGNDDGGNGDDA